MSAAATELGDLVVPEPPRTRGGVAKLPGEDWKNAVKLLPLVFAETMSWSPSVSMSAVASELGDLVISGPPRKTGETWKVPGEDWMKTARLLVTVYAEMRSWSPSSSRSAVATELGESAPMLPRERGVEAKPPGEDWKKIVIPRWAFAETMSWSPSPSRSAATTQTGLDVRLAGPRTMGEKANLPGETWRNTVRLLWFLFEKMRSWTPSPLRSAACRDEGKSVAGKPPRTTGAIGKLAGEF